tara:strand:+ start:155 stop:1018 length:864 start_codon:yes stop_codon:yes gene_type:complete
MDLDQKSIYEILEVINNEDAKVHSAVNKVIPEISELIKDVINCFKKGGRLFYIGAGTSGRIGVLDASECPPTYRTNSEMIQGIIAGGLDALIYSIEGAEDNQIDGEYVVKEKKVGQNDIILGISASGTTPYVLAALKAAKTSKAKVGLLIFNNLESPEFIDHFIPIMVGPEVVTGSTRMKAGTATKLVLNMISTTSMIKLNKTYGNIMVDLKACNKKLWDRGARIIMHFTDLKYSDAMDLLKLAKGKVKVALVIQKLNLSFDNAEHILNKNKGSLRRSLQGFNLDHE